MSKDHPSSDSSTTGVTHEFRRLKGDTAASAAELREFVGRLRGKSPAEVLGQVSESHLVSSIGLAALVCGVVLIVGTLIPYALQDGETVKVPEGSERGSGPTAAASAEPGGESSTPAQQQTRKTANTATDNTAEENASQAAAALGIDETKTADPQKNPLEDNLDNLLDSLK